MEVLFASTPSTFIRPVEPPAKSLSLDPVHIASVAQMVAHGGPAFLHTMMTAESQNSETRCRFLWPQMPGNDYFCFMVWATRFP
ncbi:hypothetical protein HDU82_002785, partial [Entophlyctis luteolus]